MSLRYNAAPTVLAFTRLPIKQQKARRHAHRSKPVRPLALHPAVLLLSCSNIFMTFAWYGNLKFKAWTMVFAILVSWGIAFVEYCFAVPANRIGNAIYSPAELKSIQEVITLIVFAGFTAFYFREPLTLIQGAGFALIGLGAMLVFQGQS
jgi:uncharacterized protein (DUF486 family)